jgi:hypothetical protein
MEKHSKKTVALLKCVFEGQSAKQKVQNSEGRVNSEGREDGGRRNQRKKKKGINKSLISVNQKEMKRKKHRR